MSLRIENKPEKIQQASIGWRKNEQVAFVPTLGALHEGHLALVRFAKSRASKVIVSIFVNPLQFGANEDLDKYPRTLEEDAQKLQAEGVDLLFAPKEEDLYPAGFSTRVRVGNLACHLCGPLRPGHFEGVATVVLKLFQCALPHLAVFGEKDFQQLRVVQQMVSDFNVPIEVLGFPTVREKDGLAMSSRNRFLGKEEQESARSIPESLRLACTSFRANPDGKVGQLIETVRNHLLAASLGLDYVEVAEETNLIPLAKDVLVSDLRAPRLFIAVKTPSARLIDNVNLRKGL